MSYNSLSRFKRAESYQKHPFTAKYKTIISPTRTYFCVSWTFFIWCMLGIIRWIISVILLIPILISHFSRTHSVSRSPSKLHWNLFERFFLDVHLAFTCAPASVHLTRKNAYAVVEQKIGTARYAHPNRLSLSGKNLAKLQLLIFLDFID